MNQRLGPTVRVTLVPLAAAPAVPLIQEPASLLCKHFGAGRAGGVLFGRTDLSKKQSAKRDGRPPAFGGVFIIMTNCFEFYN